MSCYPVKTVGCSGGVLYIYELEHGVGCLSRRASEAAVSLDTERVYGFDRTGRHRDRNQSFWLRVIWHR